MPKLLYIDVLPLHLTTPLYPITSTTTSTTTTTTTSAMIKIYAALLQLNQFFTFAKG